MSNSSRTYNLANAHGANAVRQTAAPWYAYCNRVDGQALTENEALNARKNEATIKQQKSFIRRAS